MIECQKLKFCFAFFQLPYGTCFFKHHLLHIPNTIYISRRSSSSRHKNNHTGCYVIIVGVSNNKCFSFEFLLLFIKAATVVDDVRSAFNLVAHVVSFRRVEHAHYRCWMRLVSLRVLFYYRDAKFICVCCKWFYFNYKISKYRSITVCIFSHIICMLIITNNLLYLIWKIVSINIIQNG